MSADIHLNHELIVAFLRGRLPAEELIERLFAHLRTACPTCRDELAYSWLAWQNGGKEEILAERMLTLAQIYATRLEKDRAVAGEELVELLDLPQAERRARVTRTPGRFRTPHLADLLIQQSRKTLFDDPKRALDLAEVAVEVALRIDPETYSSGFGLESLARALAQKGNALRVLGELRLADEVLAVARSTVEKVESGEPLAEAEILSLIASLRRDQRRFEEAEELLAVVTSVYGELEDRERLARTLVTRGSVARLQGDYEGAITAARQALEMLDPEADPWLALFIRYNLALYLADADRCEEARSLLADHWHAFEKLPDRQVQIRLRWLDARIAHGLGEHARAERRYLEVRDIFQGYGMGYDTALVCLDLAVLYLEQGRTAEVRRLTEEIVPVFRAQEVHRETLAALLLFQKAARREALTVEMVRSLALRLDQARREPALHSEPSYYGETL